MFLAGFSIGMTCFIEGMDDFLQSLGGTTNSENK
jgi:hypothetical protein